MPAIEPCLAVRDMGPVSTPSILRTAGGGVAVRSFLVSVGLAGLAFFSPSRAAMTSRRSSSSAASKLMMGGCGARARLGEVLPAMMVGRLGQEAWCGKGRQELIHACHAMSGQYVSIRSYLFVNASRIKTAPFSRARVDGCHATAISWPADPAAVDWRGSVPSQAVSWPLWMFQDESDKTGIAMDQVPG